MQNLDVKTFRFMLENAENNLLNHQKEIDAKNVFPVPDGDTGTNMTMTITTVANDLVALPEDATMSEVAKTISRKQTGHTGFCRGHCQSAFSRFINGCQRKQRCHYLTDLPRLLYGCGKDG